MTAIVVACLMVVGAVVANAKLGSNDPPAVVASVTTTPPPETETESPPDVESVAVPNLEGLAQDDAVAELEKLGLEPAYADPVSHESVPMDHVVEQAPAAGTTLDKGSEVYLTLSGGSGRMELARVPDVVGDSEQTARTKVSDANLSPNVQREPHDTVAAGYVVSTSPKAGDQVRHGGSVTIVVSSGPPPVETVPVPSDLVGLDYATARQRLADVGLVATRVETTHATVPSEQVISTSPGGGQRVNVGSSVALTVSTGPRMVTVPNVVEMDLASAEATLRAANLEPLATQEWNLLPSSAVVDRSSPGAGAEVPEGSTVTLYPRYLTTTSPTTTPTTTGYGNA